MYVIRSQANGKGIMKDVVQLLTNVKNHKEDVYMMIIVQVTWSVRLAHISAVPRSIHPMAKNVATFEVTTTL